MFVFVICFHLDVTADFIIIMKVLLLMFYPFFFYFNLNINIQQQSNNIKYTDQIWSY